MKTLLQTVLSIVVAVALLGIGLYVGSQPTLVAQLGLGGLLPAPSTNAGSSSTQTFRPQATNAGSGTANSTVDSTAVESGAADNAPVARASGGPAFQISDEQLVEIRPATAADGSFQATGVVVGADSQSILLPMAGTVQHIDVAVGDTVAAGDLLLALDGAALEQTIEEALAGLDAAQRNLDALNAEPVKNAASLPDAQQKMAEARTALETAAADLAKTQVVAPVGGTVLSIDVEIDQEAPGGTPAIVLSTGGESMLVVQLAAAQATSLSADQPVSMVSDAFPGEQFTGFVEAIAQAADPKAAMIPVTIRLADDGAAKMQPGMTAVVAFGTAQTPAGWLVPATAVQERNGVGMVFAMRDGQPVRVSVTIGETQGESMIVESPELQAGDKVVGDVSALFQGGGFPRNGNAPTNDGLPRGGTGTQNGSGQP